MNHAWKPFIKSFMFAVLLGLLAGAACESIARAATSGTGMIADLI